MCVVYGAGGNNYFKKGVLWSREHSQTNFCDFSPKALFRERRLHESRSLCIIHIERYLS